MRQGEVAYAIDLAATEGWNPGLCDAHVFYKSDPKGFFIGLLDDNPIGCISAVSYAGKFGFIGLYIVAPQYRGRGYGIQLWHHAVGRLQGHNIGLDGVVERQPQYAQSGFRLAYRNIRFEAKASPSTAANSALLDVHGIGFEKLSAYDAPFFPVQRRTFLETWRRMPNAYGLGYVQNGELLGYGILRECRNGYKIGPLFADTPDVAEALFQGLISKAEDGASVYLDVPEPNAVALALVDRHGMHKVFETARMYTGEVPDIKLEKTYGITTFELG
jgi:ribosomal protein S18 acetylase RimI-like enzyme